MVDIYFTGLVSCLLVFLFLCCADFHMLAPGLNRSKLIRSDSTEAHGRHLFHWSSQLFVGFKKKKKCYADFHILAPGLSRSHLTRNDSTEAHGR